MKSLAAFFMVVFVVYLSLGVVSTYTEEVKNLERQLNKISVLPIVLKDTK